MAKEILSNFDAFQEKFPEIKAFGDHNRVKALKIYFARGGVVSAVSRGKGWPKIIYPNPLKLNAQIKGIQESMGMFNGKKRDWEKTFFNAKIYNVKNKIFKFSDPLYWKHALKKVADSDYRQDVEAVKLPAHMVAEPKYRPMINMFVNDIEYRKQLTETVLNSIVYKKDPRVARYAQELRAFRLDTSNKNIDSLQKKVSGLKLEIKALETIRDWAKE